VLAQIAVEQGQPDDQPAVVEIVGKRRDQSVKVDRRTYRVSRNPASEQKDALDLVRGLPAVTVTPDETISLLGSPNVTVLVDGRPYQGRVADYLRTLRGSDIDQIEVITNPSAQYSAEGTGGIINFVLRPQPTQSRSGSRSVSLTSNGRVTADTMMKSDQGRLATEFQINMDAGITGRAVVGGLRSVAPEIGVTATSSTLDGRSTSHRYVALFSGKATYELGARANVSARVSGANQLDGARGDYAYTGLTPDFPSFEERQRTRTESSILTFDLTADRKGRNKGESLSASIQILLNPDTRYRSRSQLSGGGILSIARLSSLGLTRAQLDWTHPIGKSGLLSVGGAYASLAYSQRLAVMGSSEAGEDLSFTDSYDVRDGTTAFYATFQRMMGRWTLLPGLRVESFARRVSSSGRGEVNVQRVGLFPSFHMVHDVGSGVTLKFSYSRRVDRPSAEYLRPFVSVDRVLEGSIGNPALKDQTTDAYESNLHYAKGGTDAGITVYVRNVDDVWSRSYFTDEVGRAITTYINAGRRLDRGVQFDLSTSILKRVKSTLSLNLFSRRIAIGTETQREAIEKQFRYSLNGSVEWTGQPRGGVPGDTVQLQWFHDSPSREYEFERLSSNWISASYTHSLRRNLSVNATISYLTPIRSRVLSALVMQQDYSRMPVEFKVRLLRVFGK
jgi:hypothetical protein